MRTRTYSQNGRHAKLRMRERDAGTPCHLQRAEACIEFDTPPLALCTEPVGHVPVRRALCHGCKENSLFGLWWVYICIYIIAIRVIASLRSATLWQSLSKTSYYCSLHDTLLLVRRYALLHSRHDVSGLVNVLRFKVVTLGLVVPVYDELLLISDGLKHV